VSVLMKISVVDYKNGGRNRAVRARTRNKEEREWRRKNKTE